jgi:DNA-binding SARP family transcriptional activator
MTSRWELRVVGEGTLLDRGGLGTGLSGKSKRFAVLVYLAVPVPGRRVRRDELLAMFWSELDQARARNALRVILHQLGQALGPDVIVGRGEEELALDPARIHVDLADLSDAIATDGNRTWLSRASFELVPGLHVPDAPAFQDWLDQQRRAFAAKVVQAAWRAADRAEQGADLAGATAAAATAVRLARDDEQGLRRLIALLDRFGDRAGALAEFDAFTAWLAAEYEVAPAPETLELIAQIRARTRPSGVVTLPTMPAATATIPDSTAPISNPPRSRQRRPLLLAAGALIVLASVAAVWHGRSRAPRGAIPIAIAPFENQLADTAIGYAAPALGESVAEALPVTAVVPYAALHSLARPTPQSIRARLAPLGARTLVAGAVRGTRDSLELRLTIEPLDGVAPVRRLRFRGSERALLALRDSAVATLISYAHVAPAVAAAPHAPDPAAYQLSLNAAWLLSRRTRSELLKARDLYTRALELDPEWAELWLGLARANGAAAYRGFIEYRTGLRASEHAADEALRRAPDDPRPLVERSLARFQLGDDPQGAEADAKRAAALDSTDWYMQSLIGTWWQWSGGSLDSALFYTRRAERLAPWDRQVALNVLEIVGCMPDSELMLRAARHALDFDPNEPQALEALAWTLARFGRWDEATEVYRRRYPAFVAAGVASEAARLSGEARFRGTVRLLRMAAYQEQRRHPPPAPPLLENRIALFEDLGWRDSSLGTLAAVVDSLDVHHANMMCGPNLRGFRHDRRALAIVKARGWALGEFGRE